MTSLAFDIGNETPWGFLDRVEVDPCGIIRVTGWSGLASSSIAPPEVYLDSVPVPLLQVYRSARPDVNRLLKMPLPQAGLVFEYLVPEGMHDRSLRRLSLSGSGFPRLEFAGDFHFSVPHYRNLFDSGAVLHRENIYGCGPPDQQVSPEVLGLTGLLEGRVLDFGCGSGAFVEHLRSKGLDAHGVELDTGVIHNALRPAIRSFVTLYDGEPPLPFPDHGFDCVFSAEVLEHISEFERALAELARLAARRLVLVVPDISAIPMGFRHRLVPWHLLEATHINFFTQSSLERLLRPYFRHIEFGRVSRRQINDGYFHESLVAVCSV